MAIRKYRIPGLQIPATADAESLAFFNALKERLELLGGERGDPEQRSVTLRELREAGVISSQVNNGRALVVSRAPSDTDTDADDEDEQQELDFTLYPQLSLNTANGSLTLLLQGASPAERYVITLNDFLTLFARLDQENEFDFPIAFRSDNYGFELIDSAPSFRFNELAEESDTEPSRPADENIWEVEVDDSELSIYLVNDADDTRVQVLRLGRTGTNGDVLEILTDELLHNNGHVLSRNDVKTVEVDVGSSPRFSGRFTITDADIASTSKLLITLAPGPYTGKGTRADEAEMYCGIGFAATPATGSATVYWSAPSRVRGNIKVNYLIG